jgi:hypothetical protein
MSLTKNYMLTVANMEELQNSKVIYDRLTCPESVQLDH